MRHAARLLIMVIVLVGLVRVVASFPESPTGASSQTSMDQRTGETTLHSTQAMPEVRTLALPPTAPLRPLPSALARPKRHTSIIIPSSASTTLRGAGSTARAKPRGDQRGAASPHDPPVLTLASIFAAHQPSLAAYDRRNIRTLIATGDVIPARSVNYKMTYYSDFLYPFRKTADFLRAGDITLINLETPLIAGCPVTTEGLTFCGDPRAVQGLQDAGIDVACMANNHAGNYGFSGIDETRVHLRAAGIGWCGWGAVDHKTVRGLRFAFLAYNAVGQRFDYAAARSEIRAARRTADVVIVSVHWGKEYVAVPDIAPGIADDDPRAIAHAVIDDGADLIIGNHPHHVQGLEMYHGHLIVYAHGNFVFDQMWSDDTRHGVVGVYTFYGRRLVGVRYKPVVIDDYSQPHWASPAEGLPILLQMRVATDIIAHLR